MRDNPPATNPVGAAGLQRSAQDVRLSVGDVFGILWRQRMLLIAIPALTTTIVAVAAFAVPAQYDASVLLMPVSDVDSLDRGGLGSAGSQLGGLASLAGFSSGGGSLKIEAIATLESESLTERYISENKLLPLLYRSKWDPAREQWRSGEHTPTLWQANRLFRSSVRNVVDNARTGLITVTITWRDPQEAAKWANGLVAMTNQYLRDKAIHDAERNIAYLQDQSRVNNVLSVQEAISSLTETQLKKVMYAKTRDQYALKILDPATVSEKPAYPQPNLWIASAAIVGVFIAILVALLRASSYTSPRPLLPRID